MARTSSCGSAIYIEDFLAASPRVGGIVTLSRAKPCLMILDSAASVPVVGDVIVPRNTGWPSLDNRPFIVSSASATAAVLADSDTTGEQNPSRTKDDVPPATFDILAFQELCRSTLSLSGPPGATVDATTLCDDSHRVLSGLPAISTWSADGFYDAYDQALSLARDAYRSGRFVVLDVRFPDKSGVVFSAIVNQIDVTAGINAAVTNRLGGNINGAVCFYGSIVSGGLPSSDWPWSDADLVFDLDFSAGQYWSGSLGEVTAAQAFTATRTSSGDLAFDGNSLLTAFAANTPRIVPGTGLWIENSATGRLDFNDDLSNAAWVKTNMAVAQNMPSPFAAGTPAGWRITASSANATILQTIAAITTGGGAGGTDLISTGVLYLPTGVTLAGDVQMTHDGTTWTSVKSQLVAGRWVQCVGSVEANPVTARTVGIRLTASGDTIGAMLLNIDRGYLMSSPIRVPSITTVARSSEQCQMTMANFPPMGNADMPRFTFLTVVVPVSLPLPAVLDPVHPRVGWTALEFNDDDTITANGTGSIMADVMTITAIASGAYAVGQRLLVGTGAISFTDIISLGSGTGGTGTYSVHSSLSGTAPYPPTQTTPAGINLISRVKDAQGYGLNSAVKANGDQQIGVTISNELVNLNVGIDPQTATYEYNAPNAMGWSMDTLATPAPKAHVALKGDVYTSTDAQLPAAPQLGAGCYVMIGSQGGGTGPIGALRGAVARTLCIARAMSAAEIAAATNALQSAA